MSRRVLARGLIVILPALLLSSGCATKSPHPATLGAEVRQTLKSVSLADDIQIPPLIRVPRGGGGVLATMLEIKEEKFFNERVKEQLDINAVVAEKLRDGWRARVQEQLVPQGMELVNAGEGDAEFVLTVETFGLTLPSGMSAKQKPSIRLTGMLVSHPPYVLIRSKERGNRLEPADLQQNPILWMRTVEAPSKARSREYPAHGVGEYRNDANLLAGDLEIPINDALDALMDSLTGDGQEGRKR